MKAYAVWAGISLPKITEPSMTIRGTLCLRSKEVLP